MLADTVIAGEERVEKTRQEAVRQVDDLTTRTTALQAERDDLAEKLEAAKARENDLTEDLKTTKSKLLEARAEIKSLRDTQTELSNAMGEKDTVRPLLQGSTS